MSYGRLKGAMVRMLTSALARQGRRRGASAAGLASDAVSGAVRGSDPVNGYRVLEQVVRLPVSTWRYHWDPPHVRHLGPMAQDWWKAFGVGENDRTICCTDANGVAIVAIQALHRELTELREEVEALRTESSRQARSKRAPAHLDAEKAADQEQERP